MVITMNVMTFLKTTFERGFKGVSKKDASKTIITGCILDRAGRLLLVFQCVTYQWLSWGYARYFCGNRDSCRTVLLRHICDRLIPSAQLVKMDGYP